MQILSLRSWHIGVMTVALLVVFLIPPEFRSMAAEESKVITLGESLSEEQRTELLGVFDYQKGVDPEPLTVTTAETIKAMDGIFPADSISSAYSSTALTCRELGGGLDVTTSNITLVTPGLYAMALVTAGIGDATLVVAAPESAKAQGMTALTGVFKTWDIKPCASGNTNKERQRLALEELTLTVQIGQALATPDGVQVATDLVLNTQQAIVTGGLTGEKAIDEAITAQEDALGVTVPAEFRPKLVDLMTRLAAQKIDWSTFSAGWIIERPSETRITMTGDGIAIRNAQMTATARAALTQTAAAKPTITPTATPSPSPTPTATPTPVALIVRGTVSEIGGGQISIEREGLPGQTVTYQLGSTATLVRDGSTASLESVRKGDGAELTIDQVANEVTRLVATSAPPSGGIGFLSWLLLGVGALGLLGIVRIRAEEPFILRRA